MKIILDNGHGNNTPGKRSPMWADRTELYEWEFNRDIVRRIKIQIPDAIVLVPELFDVNLHYRAQRANRIFGHASLNNEECLLISIHGNAGGGSGFEVWTTPGKTKADAYATLMFFEMQKVLNGQFPMRQDRTDNDPDKEAKFYILKKTECPAILTENLFMDNETDCRFMMSEEGRRLIADAHINFIRLIQ